MPIEEKGEEKKNEGQNIAGFHAGCLHQRPGGQKTLEQMQE